MSQIKRQFDFHPISGEQTKRFRKTICLEDLSNELFFEVFDYLDGCDIHQAFSNLNGRFQRLLTNSLLPLKVHLSRKSQSTLEHRCRHAILPNKHRILSLHLHDHTLIQSFFDHCILDASFVRLQSIVLNSLSAYKLMTILFYVNSLPKLASLIIQLEEDYYYNLSDIYRLIFRLPYLKYCKVSLSDCEELEISIPMSLNETPSTIECLILNFACTVKELTSLLLHTPQLQRVTCERLVETDEAYSRAEQLILPHLTSFALTDCDIEFDEFEVFIKNICPQLRALRLKTSCHLSYLDAKRWQQLIKKHMPYLREFRFDCQTNTDDWMDVTPDLETIHQFTSTFWIERRWVFQFKDISDEFVYSIHPPKKMWFDDLEYSQTLHRSDRMIERYLPCQQQSDQTATRSIQLVIEGYTVETWEASYIDRMKRCFTEVQFTHLNIDCKGLPIGMLIEIIRLLPSLHSLEVSSLPLLQSSTLSLEDAEILLLVSITNKTTKVKLNPMNDVKQIYFLMDLCPRMEYLEVEITTEIDLDRVLGCISLNNNTRVPFLSCLCLCVPDADESIVQNIHDIIDFERLFQMPSVSFRDYAIQSRQNKVFLNWKLSHQSLSF